MSEHVFSLCGETLSALPSGALWWKEHSLLCVSDLHFGKAQRAVRRGGAALPPYEVRDTLARLERDICSTGARKVVCLGDSFDDAEAPERMLEDDRLWLLQLMARREWVWIAGNHDPGPMGLGGTHCALASVGALVFRHIAITGTTGEVSGHFHPKALLSLGAGKAVRPCFLIDDARVILPAYGSYTGGLDCRTPELAGLMGPEARAILTGTRCLVIPMPRYAAATGRRARTDAWQA